MQILDDTTAHSIAQQALPAWDLSNSQIELISRSENIVFRVDSDQAGSGQPYVLRIHRPGYHTLDELNAEQEWTEALTEFGLGVPVAVKTSDGRGYARVHFGPEADAVRYVGMVEWFEGTPLRHLLAAAPDESAMVHYFGQLGQIAARIHNQSSGWIPPSADRRHALDADGLMGEAPFWGVFWDLPQLSRAECKRLLEIRDSIHRILTKLGKDPQHYGLIHADLHPGNLLINEDNLHVIDFDDCAYSWHLYELAISLFYSMDEPYFDQIRDALIAGYRTQRDLPDDTVALLPLFLLIRGLSLIGWTYLRPELGRSERIPKLVARALEEVEVLGL